jgi:hypothetical protein
MALPRGEICDCGNLERFSRERGHPIRWDESLNEFYIAHGNSGRTMLYYCPFCGGSTPKSRRTHSFRHLTDQENRGLTDLIRGLKTLEEVIAKFGSPEFDQVVGMTTTEPERDGQPETAHVYRELFYQKLSEVADVHVTVDPTGKVDLSFRGKCKGDELPRS